MASEDRIFHDIGEQAKPFETHSVSGGAENYSVKPDIRSFGIVFRHGRIIHFAEGSTGGDPVEQAGEWFTVSSDINPKVVGDSSPQSEALVEHFGPPPRASVLRQIMESYRRRQRIRKLPPGLRPSDKTD